MKKESVIKILLAAILLFAATAWAQLTGASASGWIIGAPTVGGGGITPSLAASRTSGVGPIGVVFDATGTTHGTVTEPFRRLDYEIDYGDDTGTWTTGTGNTDKGKDFSPLGAHVYYCTNGTTCTYTSTLTVRDGTVTTASATLAITVYDPESTGDRKSVV